MIVEQYAPGMTAMAAPVLRRTGEAVGVITIAGPLPRLSAQRMTELAHPLKAAATELGMSGATSPMFTTRTPAARSRGRS